MIFIPRTSLQSVGFCVCTPPRHTTENPDFGGNSPVSLSCEIFGVVRNYLILVRCQKGSKIFMTEEEIRQHMSISGMGKLKTSKATLLNAFLWEQRVMHTRYQLTLTIKIYKINNPVSKRYRRQPVHHGLFRFAH